VHASTRDEPVNLSDSRSETHQHCSPADATCCQSLLLNPDATLSIDLHKRLFLLVSGRGEQLQDFPYHGCALPTELGGASSVSAVRNQYCGCDADRGTCTSGTHSQTASLMIPDRRGIGSANGRLISSPCVVPAYTQEPRPCSCPRRRENHGLHRGGCTSSHNAVRSHTRQHQPSGDVQPTVLSVPAPPCQALVSVRPLACQGRRFSHLLNSTDTTERDAGMLLLLRPPPAPPG
jgi:hypothetical protein